jgi:hypothetical protein
MRCLTGPGIPADAGRETVADVDAEAAGAPIKSCATGPPRDK